MLAQVSDTSPITGKTVATRSEYSGPLANGREFDLFWWEHEADGFAPFMVTNDARSRVEGRLGKYFKAIGNDVRGTGSNENFYYSHDDTRAALDLIRSYLWRTLILQSKTLVVCSQSDFNDNGDELVAYGLTKGYIVRTFDSFVVEARTLTFEAKAMGTLENILTFWRKNKTRFSLPYLEHKSITNEPFFQFRPEFRVDGIAFGCSGEESVFVYQYLYEQGLIDEVGGTSQPTGKGMVALDRLRRGGNSGVRRAFLVRMWSPDLDAHIRPVLDKVGERLSCPIKALWEEEHNDRLDERIFRLIRESSVCVVDISHVPEKPDLFNVGLELGYAYALGKPIVLIRRKPPEGALPFVSNIPFDISTLNCHTYETTEAGLAELERKLEARIGLELDLMALK